jgi:hypothetical protein
MCLLFSEANDEFDRLTASLNAMLERIQNLDVGIATGLKRHCSGPAYTSNAPAPKIGTRPVEGDDRRRIVRGAGRFAPEVAHPSRAASEPQINALVAAVTSG